MARMIFSFPFPLLLLASTCLSVASGQGSAPITQTATPVTVAAPSIPLPTPTPSGVLGHIDAAALKEVGAHRLAVGGLPWTGMQGTGQITFGASSTAYSVTLSNFGPRAFRLDVTTPKGISSTRINGFVGKVQESDGTTTAMATDNCLAGLFSFELVRATPLSSPTLTLTDGGTSTIEGVVLHRVTLERATMGHNPTTKQRQTVAVDLYFDPSTHLLVKSRAPVDIGRNVRLVSDVTYGDYRPVGTVMVPFHFAETIDGQQYRSLQLSAVTLVPTLDSTLFTF